MATTSTATPTAPVPGTALQTPGSAPAPKFYDLCLQTLPDGRHLVADPDNVRDTAVELSEKYMATRQTYPPPAIVRTGGGAQWPSALTRDVLLAGNSAIVHWDDLARNKDCNGVLVWPLGVRVTAATVGTVSDDILKAVTRILGCTTPRIVNPQVSDVGQQFSALGHPRVFLIAGLAPEDTQTLTRYPFWSVEYNAADAGPTPGSQIMAIGAVKYDLPPMRYVCTLRKPDGLATDEQTKTDIRDMVKAHITLRGEEIQRNVDANRSAFWGGKDASAPPLAFKDRLLPSIRVEAMVNEAVPVLERDRLYRLSVYALGLYTDPSNVQTWNNALLGSSIPLGVYGTGIPAWTNWLCHYCLQVDHNTRGCPISKTTGWLDRFEDRQHAADLAQAANIQANPPQPATRGAGRGGPGSRGRATHRGRANGRGFRAHGRGQA